MELGSGNVEDPYAVVLGPCRIGDDDWIGPHVVLRTPPEIRGHDHGASWDGDLVGRGVEIGDHTTLREHATVHSGSAQVTRIGSEALLMNKVYVGHDSDLGDGVTPAASVLLGGHVVVGGRAHLGLGTVVHHRRVVGPDAMVGMGPVVARDVPPCAEAFGSPTRVHGVNAVGIRRQGASEADVAALAEFCGGGRDVVAHWPPAATRAHAPRGGGGTRPPGEPTGRPRPTGAPLGRRHRPAGWGHDRPLHAGSPLAGPHGGPQGRRVDRPAG